MPKIENILGWRRSIKAWAVVIKVILSQVFCYEKRLGCSR